MRRIRFRHGAADRLRAVESIRVRLNMLPVVGGVSDTLTFRELKVMGAGHFAWGALCVCFGRRRLTGARLRPPNTFVVRTGSDTWRAYWFCSRHGIYEHQDTFP